MLGKQNRSALRNHGASFGDQVGSGSVSFTTSCAPAVRQALEIMVYCYEKMDLKELADKTRVMYRANYEGEIGEGRNAPVNKKKWYKLWLAT